MVRVGVIGLGIMGTYMIREFDKDPRFNVTAIWDLNPENVERVQQEFPDLVAVPDAAALVARDDVDFVYIATPPSSHIAYCHLSLDHKKPVLCEKPLSTDHEASRALVQRVGEVGVSNAVNFQFEVMGIVNALMQAKQSGDIGDLVAVEVSMHFSQWPRVWQKAGNWLHGRSEGGFVREVFSHYAFLTDLICGPLTIHSKHLKYPVSGSEVSVSVALHSGNVPVRLVGTVGGAAPEYINWTLYGSKTSYRILNWATLQRSTGDSWENVDVPSQNPLDAVYQMLNGQPHLLADFAAGFRTQNIIESIVGGLH